MHYNFVKVRRHFECLPLPGLKSFSSDRSIVESFSLSHSLSLPLSLSDVVNIPSSACLSLSAFHLKSAKFCGCVDAFQRLCSASPFTDFNAEFPASFPLSPFTSGTPTIHFGGCVLCCKRILMKFAAKIYVTF